MSGLSTPPSTQLDEDSGIALATILPPTHHPIHYNENVPDPIIFQVCSILFCFTTIVLNGHQLRVG